MLQIFNNCGNITYIIGASPSGKASDSDSDIPVFESQYPSQTRRKRNIACEFFMKFAYAIIVTPRRFAKKIVHYVH